MKPHSRTLSGLCLMGALAAALPVFAADTPAAKTVPSPEAKYYQPPQNLRNAVGEPEFGLVDPFSRGPREAADASVESGDPSLLRTTMGQMDEGFRILAIAVPEKTGKSSALIQLDKAGEPTLVHEGDLVRIDRKKDARYRYQKKSAVEEALDRYTFYIHIKKISATGLEVYYNKKRPDDTIILRW